MNIVTGSKQYTYSNKESARNAAKSAQKAKVSNYPVPDDENSIFVPSPSEPATKESKDALRKNCTKIQRWNGTDWETIEENTGSGLETVKP